MPKFGILFNVDYQQQHHHHILSLYQWISQLVLIMFCTVPNSNKTCTIHVALDATYIMLTSYNYTQHMMK